MHEMGDVKEVRFDESQPQRRIVLDLGDRLEVSLESNPTTGFQWQVAALDMGVLDWTEGPSYVPSAPERIGSGGTSRFVFLATRKGRVTLRLVYRRSWEEGVRPNKTMVLKVKVR
jgi:inhibitor of cysteine peptidase